MFSLQSPRQSGAWPNAFLSWSLGTRLPLWRGQLDQIAAILLELAGGFGIDVVAVTGGFGFCFGRHDLLGFGGEAMNFVGAEDAAFAQDFLLLGGEGGGDLGLLPLVVP